MQLGEENIAEHAPVLGQKEIPFSLTTRSCRPFEPPISPGPLVTAQGLALLLTIQFFGSTLSCSVIAGRSPDEQASGAERSSSPGGCPSGPLFPPHHRRLEKQRQLLQRQG
jgi:hypothetical protein